MNQPPNIMTKRILLLAGVLALLPAFAQSPPPPTAPPTLTPPASVENFNSRLQSLMTKAAGAPEPVLTKFSLDFLGGSPKQLVAAIEKAMGKPLNAIIPPEYADTKLPPLKMSNVDVRQLFQALELTSQKVESFRTGTTYTGGFQSTPAYQQTRTSYGFRTQGPLSDESIWYFYVEKPALPTEFMPPARRVCRYFSLTPYLESGQTVEDITTAIQTGWKMLGDKETPTISFHKETKLLIAVGEPEKLETIDAVLNALRSVPFPPRPAYIDPATGIPVPPSSAPTPTIPQRALKTPAAAGASSGNAPVPSKP